MVLPVVDLATLAHWLLIGSVSACFNRVSNFSHRVLIQDSPCECVAIVGDLELVPRAQLLGLVGVPEG